MVMCSGPDATAPWGGQRGDGHAVTSCNSMSHTLHWTTLTKVTALRQMLLLGLWKRQCDMGTLPGEQSRHHSEHWSDVPEKPPIIPLTSQGGSAQAPDVAKCLLKEDGNEGICKTRLGWLGDRWHLLLAGCTAQASSPTFLGKGTRPW